MCKERTFQKKITVENFKIIKAANLKDAGKPNFGRSFREVAEIIVEIYYTPRGYCVDVCEIAPLHLWDFDQFCKIQGISDEHPEGDLQEMNFNTMKSAMHFITGRFKEMGWTPDGKWTLSNY